MLDSGLFDDEAKVVINVGCGRKAASVSSAGASSNRTRDVQFEKSEGELETSSDAQTGLSRTSLGDSDGSVPDYVRLRCARELAGGIGLRTRPDLRVVVLAAGEGDKDPDYDVWGSLTGRPWAEGLQVSFGLLARLFNFMAFKERHKKTFTNLGAMARHYAKDMGMAPEHLALVLHNTIVVAAAVPERERRALSRLAGLEGDRMVAWGERLRTGLLYERGSSYWIPTMASYMGLVGGASWVLYRLAGLVDWSFIPWGTLAPFAEPVSAVALMVLCYVLFAGVRPTRRAYLPSA
jgi:hypothetical protein